jgi:hypothetical protein
LQEVDAAADWVVVFDTEFSPNVGSVKVRSTSQIPLSGVCVGACGGVVMCVSLSG